MKPVIVLMDSQAEIGIGDVVLHPKDRPAKVKDIWIDGTPADPYYRRKIVAIFKPKKFKET